MNDYDSKLLSGSENKDKPLTATQATAIANELAQFIDNIKKNKE